MTTLGHVLAFAVAFVFVASIWNRLHERHVRCHTCGSRYHRTSECFVNYGEGK